MNSCTRTFVLTMALGALALTAQTRAARADDKDHHEEAPRQEHGSEHHGDGGAADLIVGAADLIGDIASIDPSTKELHWSIGAGTTAYQNQNGSVSGPSWQLGGALTIRPAGSGVRPMGPTPDDSHVTIGVTGGPQGGSLDLQTDMRLDGANNVYISVGSDRLASLGPNVNRGVIPIGVRIDAGQTSTFRVMWVPIGIYNDNTDNLNSVGTGLRLEYVAHLLGVLDLGAGIEGLATGASHSAQVGVGGAGSANVFAQAHLGQHVSLLVQGITDFDALKSVDGGGNRVNNVAVDRRLDAGVQLAF